MKHINIIGAGTAGVYLSIRLKQLYKNIEVTVFERNDKPLKKLLATGNGRCNLSNKDLSKNHYDGSMTKKQYNSIFKYDLESMFKELNIETKWIGDLLYPISEQALTVKSLLLEHAESLGVHFIYDDVLSVDENYKIYTNSNKPYDSDLLILACGTSAGRLSGDYDRSKLLESLKISIKPYQPSLTKMITDPSIKMLKGTRVKGTFTLMKGNKTLSKEKGELLFNDYGVSGIAIMNLSRYYEEGCTLHMDLLDNYTYEETEELLHNDLHNPYMSILPIRLANYLYKKGVKASLVKDFTLKVKGLKGQEDAQAMKGGIVMNQLTDHLEFKIYPGMYACGEMLDVTGDCGGYNLYYAFASAETIALDIKKHINS